MGREAEHKAVLKAIILLQEKAGRRGTRLANTNKGGNKGHAKGNDSSTTGNTIDDTTTVWPVTHISNRLTEFREPIWET